MLLSKIFVYQILIDLFQQLLINLHSTIDNQFPEIMISHQSLPYYGIDASNARKKQAKLTNQQRFWKKFKTEQFKKFDNNISCISSNHNKKNLVAVGHGIGLTLFNAYSKQIVKQVNSFIDIVSAVSIRKDGAVMAVAQETGNIQVIDTKQRFMLRKFNNNKKKVTSMEFGPNSQLYSVGQDMFLRMFDVATGSIVSSFQNAHDDYITCLKVLSDHTVLCGGYDKKINMFDLRVNQNPQLSFDHRSPVENIDKFSSNLSFVACGGQKVSLWDIRSAQKSVIQIYGSKKLVSSIKIVSNNSRIITGSYDNHFKIYRSDTFELTYQQRFDQAITHLDITEDQKNVAIGLLGGNLLLKGHNKSIEEIEEKDKKPEKGKKEIDEQQSDLQIEDEIALWMRKNQQKKDALNDKYFYRGIYSKADNYDMKFDRVKAKKLNKFDKYLKKFQYKEALLQSLCRNKNFVIFQALVDQYIQRGCLDKTIKSLKDQEVGSVVQSLSKQVHNPHHAKTVLYICDKILEYHWGAEIEWSTLYQQMDKQREIMQNLLELDGMLEFIERIDA